jgi:antitoxin (DNA-binding transcriptional repressor) of toxin-antitoxin stability system
MAIMEAIKMKQYNIAEAKSRFSELVKLALLGEEVVIARDNKPLLRLMPVAAARKKRVPGSAKGQILSISPDFDDLPADFKEYV